MKNRVAGRVAWTLLFLWCPPAFSQGEAGLPFLTYVSSPVGNGMGGIAATLPLQDPMATIANPGQLGLFSLNSIFSASMYTPKTDWQPQYGLTERTFNTTALSFGWNFKDMFSLPFQVSVGAGYSRVYHDLGTFILTGPGGPSPTGTVAGYDKSESLSLGVGLEYYVQIGLGFNFKSVESSPGFLGAFAKVSTSDFGAMLCVPIMRIVSDLSETQFEVIPKVEPFLDLSSGYVKANTGDKKVVYIDPDQADPLSRTAIVGLGIELGMKSRVASTDWKVASFAIARQAEDLLITYRSGGGFVYQTGLGDLKFFDNVVLGKSNPLVRLRRGWQVQLAEVVFVRGGFVDDRRADYSTSGLSICLAGAMKLAIFVDPTLTSDSWVGFIAEHFDLQYHRSGYDHPIAGVDRRVYQSLNIVLRAVPF